MKLTIDDEEKYLLCEKKGEIKKINLYSDEAFKIISKIWLKVGWNQKNVYTFSWLGRPIIQLPEDMMRMQEVIFKVKPDVIIETGIAHGGSLIFYASLCKSMNKGRVIGVDIEIRKHNRKAIEEHFLFDYITLIEGNSIDEQIIQKVKSCLKPKETVLVILDSCHTYAHVKKELEAYAPLVTKDSYIVATDGSMQMLYDVPRGKSEWQEDNPVKASREFLDEHDDFILEIPEYSFNESSLDNTENTHWPEAWLKRIK